jgi:hypothetical protein
MRASGARSGVELTGDRMFSHRIRRLVGVSLVALGVITWLAVRSEGSNWAITLLVIGWILMPTLLFVSLSMPLLRYLLVVPGTTVSIGLIGMTVGADGTEALGWFLIFLGITVGGLMGMWFWYRWVPVPRMLDDPYGWPRLTVLALHIGFILIGAALVFAST